MKFYSKYTPKELNEKFGIISVHFEPYDDMSYLWETDSIKSLTQSVKELAYSTIFEDFRYNFKDAESLKKFIKEKTNERNKQRSFIKIPSRREYSYNPNRAGSNRNR